MKINTSATTVKARLSSHLRFTLTGDVCAAGKKTGEMDVLQFLFRLSDSQFIM